VGFQMQMNQRFKIEGGKPKWSHTLVLNVLRLTFSGGPSNQLRNSLGKLHRAPSSTKP
jgi:hypothetical protein